MRVSFLRRLATPHSPRNRVSASTSATQSAAAGDSAVAEACSSTPSNRSTVNSQNGKQTHGSSSCCVLSLLPREELSEQRQLRQHWSTRRNSFVRHVVGPAVACVKIFYSASTYSVRCLSYAPSTTTTTNSRTKQHLTEEVLACIPRSPAYATMAALQSLLLSYDDSTLFSCPYKGIKSNADVNSNGSRSNTTDNTGSAPSTLSGQSIHRHRPTLSPISRRMSTSRMNSIRASYGTLKNMLLKLSGHEGGAAMRNSCSCDASSNVDSVETLVYRGGGRYGVYVSCDLTLVTVAASAQDAGRTFRAAYEAFTPSDLEMLQRDLEAVPPHGSRQPIAASAAAVSANVRHDAAAAPSAPPPPPLPPFRESANAVLYEEDVLLPEDLCYSVVSPTSSSSHHHSPTAREVQHRNSVLSRSLKPQSSKVAEPLLGICGPYFGDDFVPPAPPDVASTEAGASATRGTTSPSTSVSRSPQTTPNVPSAKMKNTFTPGQIGALLPTYFVPMDALLAQLPPGYTAEHVRTTFFATGAVEVVQIGAESFVRFYGGREADGFSTAVLASQEERFRRTVLQKGGAANRDGKSEEVRETGTGGTKQCGHENGGTEDEGNDAVAEAEAQLDRCVAAYKPDPYLLQTFFPRFARPYEWVPLFDLVEHAPPSVQHHLLPLRQRTTLLFFAQQQQHVQFTPQNGGKVALCYPPTRALRMETTPLPCVVAEVIRLLHNRGAVYVEEMESGAGYPLSDYAKRHIIAHFGSLRRFFYQHEALFRLSVFASPATLYEHRTQSTAAAAAASGTIATTTAGMAGKDEGKTEEVSLDAPPLPATLPRPGRGFAGVPQPYHCVVATVDSVKENHTNNNNTAAAAAEGGVCADAGDDAKSSASSLPFTLPPYVDDQLDERGFPRWLASRDVAVQLAVDAMHQERHRVPLEEQLEKFSSGNRMKERKLRRRRAATANPNSPYSDPTVLLDAIVRYLPAQRHISLRALLSALPMSMQDFLPNNPARLFRSAPDKVQIFEYRRRHHLRVMRAGLPLPDGRLKSTYTEEELLHLIAAAIPPGRSKLAVSVYTDLPMGARETVRLQHKHLLHFVEQYPEYFVVVYKDALRKKGQMASIAVVKSPPRPKEWNRSTDDEVAAGGGAPLTELEMSAIDNADRAALLAEMAPDLRATVPNGTEE